MWTIVAESELKTDGEKFVHKKAPLGHNYPELKLNGNPLKKKEREERNKEERNTDSLTEGSRVINGP